MDSVFFGQDFIGLFKAFKPLPVDWVSDKVLEVVDLMYYLSISGIFDSAIYIKNIIVILVIRPSQFISWLISQKEWISNCTPNKLLIYNVIKLILCSY